MNTEFFITKRIAFTKGKSFSRFIIRVAVVAVALSVSVMIIAGAMITGFQKEISNKIFDFWGHIHIQKYEESSSYEDEPISIRPSFYDSLKKINGVTHIQVFARKAGIIKTDSDIEGIVLKGIGKDFNWNLFNQYIIAGSALHGGDSSDYKKIIISQTTADRLRLKLGEKLRIFFLKENQQVGRVFTITGIYKTGLLEYDKVYALVDIAQIQRLNGWTHDEVGGFEVFINDVTHIDELGKTINEDYVGRNLTALTIKEVYPNIFDWLNLQNTNERVILILMTLVAAINMITALLILILERTNMIGILKSLGATNWSVRKIFLLFAGYIISLGLIWGNFIGIGLCLIQKYCHVIRLPEESYYISVAPINLDSFFILLINVATLIVCLLVLIIPSYLVTRIQPVKAIRFS
jgi:lipoprotein-releasing system permease protein